MLRSLALWAALSLGLRAAAREPDVRVGLLRDITTRQVMVMGSHGPLTLLADGKKVGELGSNDGLKLECTANGIVGKSLSLALSAKRTFTLRSPNGRGFRLRSLGPQTQERTYPGAALEVQRVGDAFLLVAVVPLEEYVAGVVQSEAGKDKAPEYYKLQAVSCRTYALANQRRHAGEGFSVCDGTHCQVFLGRCTLDTIKQAVTATRDMVVVDADIRLIHATFHSNCGGETMNAEDLWSKSEPYLVSTLDTFCLHAPHATWQQRMPRVQWLGYLKKNYGVDTADPRVAASVTEHDPACRELYLGNIPPYVPLARVRTDLKLNSTYFRIRGEGDQVVFEGRGFGHGVGLCQEGAMRMARVGYPFIDILHHYFAEVHLVDLKTIDFFRDEGR